MILEETDGLLTMKYVFDEERLSFIIHNEDGSETQINIGLSGIAKLTNIIEVISEDIAKRHQIP